MSTEPSFRENESIIKRIVASYQLVERSLAERTGLNVTDLSLLSTLDAADRPLTAGTLSQAVGLTSGATTTAIDRLVAAGLAQRQRSDSDRRAVLVSLNQPNASAVLRLVEPLVSQRRALWLEFTVVEQRAILRFLERSQDMAQQWSVLD